MAGELARLAPQLILPGKPARGGGRAGSEGLAIEVSRLAALTPALQRRLVRHAAEQLGGGLDFAATEAVRSLMLGGRAGQRLALPQGLCAERTARELRLSVAAELAAKGSSEGAELQRGHSRQHRRAGVWSAPSNRAYEPRSA